MNEMSQTDLIASGALGFGRKNFRCDLTCEDQSVHETNFHQDNVMHILEKQQSDEEFSGRSEDDVEQGTGEAESVEIGQLRKWAVENHINQVALDGLLNILNKRLLPQLPSSSKTFLKTLSSKYVIECMKGSDDCEGEFTYMSILEGLEVCLNHNLHKNNIIELDFNIDGAKTKKCSPKSLWPILCKVLYKPYPYAYKPFPVAVFYGKGKPKDVLEYLKKFVVEINSLQKNGAIINEKHYRIQIRSFICDIPAKAFIKCTRGHTSFNGCEKCDVIASKNDLHTTVYLDVGKKRTGLDFINYKDPNHHNGVSPLISIDPPIDLADQFVIDPLHMLYLGVNARILDELLSNGSKSPVKIGPAQKKELSRRSTIIKKDIPEEFSRKMPSTNECNDWKATEHRFFLLYCSPLILKDIVSDSVLDNFLFLHAACRILSSHNALRYSRIARNYLTQFVEQSKTIYSSSFVTLNVHYLNHLVDDVENMQSNINDISAFPFENELGKIKKILRSPHRTLAQYCRRLHEERETLDLKAKLPDELVIVKEHKTNGLVSLWFQQQFLSVKHPNNTVMLDNGSVVKIIKMFKQENSIFLTVVTYKSKSSAFKHPCDSSFLDIYEILDQVTLSTKRNVPLSSVKSKMVKMSISLDEVVDKKSLVVPLLH
uniref:Transposase domain-containing protein n=1 Tax=Trichogramma kaykai TaxID=54128 RepID=A0ABD2WAF9_9HYME